MWRAVEEVGGGKARMLHVAHHGGLDGSRRESRFCRINLPYTPECVISRCLGA